MYMSGNKKQTGKRLHLKETKDLYERLMVLARSNRRDQKQAVVTYEFTLTPWSLFAPDGSVLLCSDKLIHALEKMVTTDTDHADQQEQPDESTHSTTSDANHCKIAVVDGMVMTSPEAIKESGSCGDSEGRQCVLQ